MVAARTPPNVPSYCLFFQSWHGFQSNAVGWLTQSITGSLKVCQQQVVTAVDTVARCVWMPVGYFETSPPQAFCRRLVVVLFFVGVAVIALSVDVVVDAVVVRGC